MPTETPEMIAEKMKNRIENLFANTPLITLIMSIIVFFFIFSYIYNTLKKRTNNCSILDQDKYQYAIIGVPGDSVHNDATLKEYYIKTAYNACCTGNLRNDYVDNCALNHCARFGVRALDFQIYSRNNKPVISASSLSNDSNNSFKYKELYNSLDFSETMTLVKSNFTDPSVSRNANDPLFLIFRLYTNKVDTLDQMYSILTSVFNRNIYDHFSNNPIDDLTMKEAKGKVFILIDPTGSSNYSKSKLRNICSLQLGTLTNKIYRESTVISNIDTSTLSNTNSTGIYGYDNYLNVVYPDLNGDAVNYDSITSGIVLGIQFIGMNYQINDDYLTQFEYRFKQNKNNSNDVNAYGIILKSEAKIN
jgi:hypothetical protein